jgi:hypothetical protein
VEWEWVLEMLITAAENNMVGVRRLSSSTCGLTVGAVCIQDLSQACFSKQNDLAEANYIFASIPVAARSKA